MFKKKKYDLVVIGGGAAGFFHALNFKVLNPEKSVVIVEKGNKLLSKVLVSGGGRCNVTHACFEPKELVKYYPRGAKELIGPFHKFQPGDTIAWFAERGVELKIEEDGRMFPITDSSMTIIDCFINEAKQLGVEIVLQCALDGLTLEKFWQLETQKGKLNADRVFFAAGSSPKAWKMLGKLGMHIVDPVPSLFTFNIKDPRIKDLQGVSVQFGSVRLLGIEGKFEEYGPVLITHWGLSGPGILKLSSRAALGLALCNYRFKIEVNFNNQFDEQDAMAIFQSKRTENGKQKVMNDVSFELPKRLWHTLVDFSGINENENWADLSKAKLEALAHNCCSAEFEVNGKSTFKDEFVTAGGVELKEIDFKTMEAKRFPGLYFGGEVLNIDALTGGFNFQAAWTTAWIAAQHR